MADSAALQRIGQIAITAQDVDRAVSFYRDVLGLKLLFQAPPGLAFFDCGGVRLMLSLAEAEGDAPAATTPDVGTSVLYYVVGDIAAAHRLLSDRGVAFVGEPHVVARMSDHDLWMAFFRDSEGNLLALMHEARH
jgi:methylmalonyl-CoA/ethylmalonyl-CoA epimerase